MPTKRSKPSIRAAKKRGIRCPAEDPRRQAKETGTADPALFVGQNDRRREAVIHPSHYGGDVPHEVIKCLEAWGLESDALLWNTVKYIARSGKKGRRLEDLEKARFYLDRRIATLRSRDPGNASSGSERR